MWIEDFSYGNGLSANQIIVPGTRPVDPWVQTITPQDFYELGMFNIQDALFGAPRPDPFRTSNEPEMRVERDGEQTKPSEGQEDFADDGDPFNDGEAPTAQTVTSWLEALAKDGAIDTFIIVKEVGDQTDTTYNGWYVLDGQTNSFFSDGNGGYGQIEPTQPDPAPGGLGFGGDDFLF